MLEELVYSKIDGLKTISNTRPYIEIAAEKAKSRRRLNSFLLNNFFSFRAQSPHRVLQITNPRLDGHRAIINNAYIVKPGDELKFTARYVYTGAKPELLIIEQSIDSVKKSFISLFPPKSYIEVSVSSKIDGPKNITCKALSKPRPGRPGAYIIDTIRLNNSLTLTYPVGLFDDRLKPASEYPVSGADNAVLDIAYPWQIENTVYPQPVLEGLTFSNMRVGFASGFLQYEGKYYKDPSSNNTVRLSCRVSNNSQYDLNVRHLGLVVAVLYDDSRRVSQANVSVSFPSFDLNRRQYRDYYIDVNLPSWAYGRVAVAHALNFYDKATNTLRYTGGPFYKFEVYRLRLP